MMRLRWILGLTLVAGALVAPAPAGSAAAEPTPAPKCTVHVGVPLRVPAPPGECRVEADLLANATPSEEAETADAGPDALDARATSWLRVPQANPNRRYIGATAYDEARGEMVVFGGCCWNGLLNDTWVRGDGRWQQLFPAASPPGRQASAMVYDAARAEIVLFGGLVCQDEDCTYSRAAGDTWTWDGNTWTRHDVSVAPSARYFQSMAYDRVSEEVVLFGGLDADSRALADTWVWDGATWTLREPAASPPRRAVAPMTFDPARGETVLFGGGVCYDAAVTYACAPANDTWTWDGTNWTQERPLLSPAPQGQTSMTYDAARREVVLYGGYYGIRFAESVPSGLTSPRGRTWTWDGSQWTEETTSHSPGARDSIHMAYDPEERATILFGGYTVSVCGSAMLEDTWSWDGAAWRKVPRDVPPAAYDGAAVYDEARREVMVFGGEARCSGEGTLGGTWTWNGQKWTEEQPSTTPPARFSASIAYDAARHETVLFGGAACPDRTRFCFEGGVGVYSNPTPNIQHLGDTWTWDGAKWTEKETPVAPSKRYDAAMTYDQERGEVVLFGGIDPSSRSALGDTWTWDGKSWTQESPATSPPARGVAAIGYDELRGNVVLFGGTDRGYLGSCWGARLSDTWTWDGENWRDVTPPNSPKERCEASMAFDRPSGRLLMSGDGNGVENDTWAWDGQSWTSLDPKGFPNNRPYPYGPFLTSGPAGDVLAFGAGNNDMYRWPPADRQGEP